MKKFMNAALAVATVAMVGIGSTAPASAGHHGHGAAIAGGVIGGLALGAILSGPRRGYVEDACYDGPPHCRIVRECYENRFGDRTCDSHRECVRDTVCD